MAKDKKEGIILVSFILILIILIISDIKFLCFFNKITGLYCPGCGTTRLLKSLFKLEIKQAFMYNQLVFILLPFIGIWFLDRVRMLLFNKTSFIPEKVSKIFWIIILILAIIFGVLRNIAFFDFLRP